VIVETMGYADEAYRLRKARMHEIMSAALEGAPVVLHEMSGAVRGEKRDRDRALWRGVMGLISGAAGAMESGDDNEEERVRGSRSEGYPRASDISSPPCLPQLLPAGTVSRAGLAPAGKPRLFTAHVESGHSLRRLNDASAPQHRRMSGFADRHKRESSAFSGVTEYE
jgi:hypothetical protein